MVCFECIKCPNKWANNTIGSVKKIFIFFITCLFDFLNIDSELVVVMNEKLKCLIIDDDPLIGDLLKHFCQKSGLVDYSILTSNATDGLTLMASGDINLVFLDFNLPDMTGQQFMELKKNTIPVIMITSNADFAIKSYDYDDIVDFLPKPLSYDRFLKAMNRLLASENAMVNESIKLKDIIYIKDGIKNVRIRFQEVLFIKSEDNYVSFVFPTTQTLTLYSLKDLEPKLPASFIRVHRSYIVNLDKIDYTTADEITIGDKKIPIGDKYKSDLENRLHHL